MTNRILSANLTIAANNNNADRAWCFADTVDGLETQDWVIYRDYSPPPASEAELGEPIDPSRRYSKKADWERALLAEGDGALWPGTGNASYVMALVKDMGPIASIDPSTYTSQLPFRNPGDVQAQASSCGDSPVKPLEIDPGDIYIFNPGTDEDEGAAIRDDQPVEGAPSGVLQAWYEFWFCFGDYTPPSYEGAPLRLGGHESRNGERYKTPGEFLKYWHDRQDEHPGATLCVASCIRLAEPPK